MTRTLEDVLSSISDVLFPEELGSKPITISSVASDGDTPLHVMTWRDDVEGALVLIEAGANVNAIGDMGQTPLHVATSQNNVEMTNLLLKAGANPDIRSEFGRTPREEAKSWGGPLAALF